MNARYILAAAIGALVISTAADAASPKPQSVVPSKNHDTSLHTSRDDLINWCTALPLQYANTAANSHTAATDALRDQGVDLCRAGSRTVGVEKLEQALKAIGATPNLD